MEIGNYYHHGDVLIKKCRIPENAQEQIKTDKVVLAEGEVTGHAHVLIDTLEKVETFKHENMIYMRIKQPIILKHEEHKQMILAFNDYMVDRVKEFDPWEVEIRKVSD